MSKARHAQGKRMTNQYVNFVERTVDYILMSSQYDLFNLMRPNVSVQLLSKSAVVQQPLPNIDVVAFFCSRSLQPFNVTYVHYKWRPAAIVCTGAR